MLFNSYDFLFVFLPIALVGHGMARRRSRRAGLAWLVVCSLGFYGWWYPPYLLLFLASVAGNLFVGRQLLAADRPDPVRRRWLTAGVLGNVLLLGWFKYAGFLAWNVSAVTGWSVSVSIALPLAISFFTFQQIAYLVDAWRGRVKPHGVLEYTLFVAFFPQLVAGPIVHHDEMLGQFREAPPPSEVDRAVGWTIFAIGLAKKALIADGMAPFADAAFDAGATGMPISVHGAWAGLAAYYLQLYFDFSGYSDMAIGLARVFGYRLPANFNAPYQADSISDFWRRWHITLSRFLRDYLYIPLGGARRGNARRNLNLFITMLLGGLWHGAGWSYVVFGALHGVYLGVNHMWRSVRGRGERSTGERLAGRGLTLAAVLVSWVIFRSPGLDHGIDFLATLAGLTTAPLGVIQPGFWVIFAAAFAFTQLAPTTQAVMARFEPVLSAEPLVPSRLSWSPSTAWGVVVGLLLLACLPVLERADAFIYWSF